MTALRAFVSDLLEADGAAVEIAEPDGLDVLAPPTMCATFGWKQDLVRLGFGAQRTDGALRVGLEGEWLDTFSTLLGERGRLAHRQLPRHDSSRPNAPANATERLLERGLDLPNAVWRFKGMSETWTRLLLVVFRYTATSDEKRDGLIRLGFNLGTGAVLDGPLLERLEAELAATAWIAPEPEPEPDAERAAAACQLDVSRLNASIPRLLDNHVRADLEPFLRSMRRRLDRDRGRVHAYHDELRKNALDKIARLGASTSDKAVADRRRETLRVQAIEREYAAKTDDLRHKYALEIKTEWVQGLVVVAPVQRFEVLIKRRKGERTVTIDWHTALKMLEPPLDEAGLGLDATRLVCDEHLHLTGSDCQICSACGKDRCPACHPVSCPSCKKTTERFQSHKSSQFHPVRRATIGKNVRPSPPGTAAVGRNGLFQKIFAAANPDLVIINLDAVDDGAQV